MTRDALREALEAFTSTAVICEHTHRVSVDEWVLSKARAAIATEARRAETTGSACEGAGPKDIAQKDHPND